MWLKLGIWTLCITKKLFTKNYVNLTYFEKMKNRSLWPNYTEQMKNLTTKQFRHLFIINMQKIDYLGRKVAKIFKGLCFSRSKLEYTKQRPLSFYTFSSIDMIETWHMDSVHHQETFYKKLGQSDLLWKKWKIGHCDLITLNRGKILLQNNSGTYSSSVCKRSTF